ncbi:bifunctional diguanylate cyclase/phosphodiesterase, partial [Staphylococcus coagulans]
TGMAAFEIPGVLGWNYPLVALSVVFAAGFGVVAANRIARPVTRFCKYGGTLAMILAIVSLHFTGMAAVTIYPVFDIAVPPQTLSDTFMITSVIVGVSLIMAMGASAYAIDLQAANEATESYKHQALHDPLTGLPNRNG